MSDVSSWGAESPRQAAEPSDGESWDSPRDEQPPSSHASSWGSPRAAEPAPEAEAPAQASEVELAEAVDAAARRPRRGRPSRADQLLLARAAPAPRAAAIAVPAAKPPSAKELRRELEVGRQEHWNILMDVETSRAERVAIRERIKADPEYAGLLRNERQELDPNEAEEP